MHRHVTFDDRGRPAITTVDVERPFDVAEYPQRPDEPTHRTSLRSAVSAPETGGGDATDAHVAATTTMPSTPAVPFQKGEWLFDTWTGLCAEVLCAMEELTSHTVAVINERRPSVRLRWRTAPRRLTPDAGSVRSALQVVGECPPLVPGGRGESSSPTSSPGEEAAFVSSGMYSVVDSIFLTRFQRIVGDPSRFPNADVAFIVGAVLKAGPFTLPLSHGDRNDEAAIAEEQPHQAWARHQGTKLARCIIPVDVAKLASMYGLVPGQAVICEGATFEVLGCVVADASGEIVAWPRSSGMAGGITILKVGSKVSPLISTAAAQSSSRPPNGGGKESFSMSHMKDALFRRLPKAVAEYVVSRCPEWGCARLLKPPTDMAKADGEGAPPAASSSIVSPAETGFAAELKKSPTLAAIPFVGDTALSEKWVSVGAEIRSRLHDRARRAWQAGGTTGSSAFDASLIESDSSVVRALFDVTPRQILWHAELQRLAVVLGVAVRRWKDRGPPPAMPPVLGGTWTDAPPPELAVIFLGDYTWTSVPAMRAAASETAAAAEACPDEQGYVAPVPVWHAEDAARTGDMEFFFREFDMDLIPPRFRQAAISAWDMFELRPHQEDVPATLLSFNPLRLPPNLLPSWTAGLPTTAGSAAAAIAPNGVGVPSWAPVMAAGERWWPCDGETASAADDDNAMNPPRQLSSCGMGDYQPSVDPFKVFRDGARGRSDELIDAGSTSPHNTRGETWTELADVMNHRNWQALLYTALVKEVECSLSAESRRARSRKVLSMLKRHGYDDGEMVWHRMQSFICRELPLTTWFTPTKVVSPQCEVDGTSQPALTLEPWIRGQQPTVLDCVSADIALRNLFEIGVGNGLQDLCERRRWEVNLFGRHAYDADAPPRARPRYGVVNLANDPKGADAQGGYGDCYLVLRADDAMRRRVTITPDDSSAEASAVATFDSGLPTLFLGCDEKVLEAVASLATGCEPWSPIQRASIGYREIQLHGDVLLHRHVTHLVINDAYVTQCLSRREGDAPGRGWKRHEPHQRQLLQFITIGLKNGWWVVPMETMTLMASWRLLSRDELVNLQLVFSPESALSGAPSPPPSGAADRTYPHGPTHHLAGPQRAECRPLYDALCHRVCQATLVYLLMVATL